MPALRDFLGSKCPHCQNDILQQAPTTNRMPGKELAWCPSCKSTMSIEDLQHHRGAAAKPGIMARLFGRPTHT